MLIITFKSLQLRLNVIEDFNLDLSKVIDRSTTIKFIKKILKNANSLM